MKTKLVLSVLLLFFTVGCRPQQYTVDSLPDNQIVFGRGVAVAGSVDTYTLLENGQLFHTSFLTGKNKELDNIGKIEAKTRFGEMADLMLSGTDFDHPGNLYYFSEEVNGGVKHRGHFGVGRSRNSWRMPRTVRSIENKYKIEQL